MLTDKKSGFAHLVIIGLDPIPIQVWDYGSEKNEDGSICFIKYARFSEAEQDKIIALPDLERVKAMRELLAAKLNPGEAA